MSLLQPIVNGLIVGSVYGSVALALAVVRRAGGFFHFGHGATATVGAYIVYGVVTSGVSQWLGILLGCLCGGLMGFFMEVSVFRWLYRWEAPFVAMMIASLGILVSVENLIGIAFGTDTKIVEEHAAIGIAGMLDIWITDTQLLILFLNCAVWLAFWALLQHTLFGKSFRAVANDSELAYALGIDVDMHRLWALTMSSAVAALAGISLALDTSLYPTIGFYALLMGMTGAIIAGVSAPACAPLGGMLLGIIQQLGVWKLPTQWQDTIVFVILIFFLLLRPQGILGEPVKNKEMV